jgi:hypothetical protein
MELNRKELELLLRSLKPTGLSEQTLDRLEQAVMGDDVLDSSLLALESQLGSLTPRPLSVQTMDKLMLTVRDVPFALDRKVLLFPGARKEEEKTKRNGSAARRILAVAACAAFGGLAAMWTPVKPASDSIAVAPVQSILPVTSADSLNDGIVATSFGTGIERAADEGVIWTQDHKPKRVLRFRYQDRVLVRDKDGVDRMLFIPREELFVVPEKVD